MKHLAVLARRPGIADETCDRALEVATRGGISAAVLPDGVLPDGVLPGGVLPGGVVLDVPHAHEGARAKFARRRRFAVDALLWSLRPAPWSTVDTAVFGSGPHLAVEQHVGWLPDDVDRVDPDDVVKQVSFLWATEGVPLDEFREHYRAHVALARRLMPTLWQYVQNDVVDVSHVADDPAGADLAAMAAVSELWFRSTDDFLHHYFETPEDQAEFQSHEGFLDLTKAVSFVCSSRVPVTVAGATRPRGPGRS